MPSKEISDLVPASELTGNELLPISQGGLTRQVTVTNLAEVVPEGEQGPPGPVGGEGPAGPPGTPAPRGSQGYAVQRVRIANVSLSTPDGTTFVDVDNTLDLPVLAVAGDVVELASNAIWQNLAPVGNLNVFTVVSGSRVNRVEPNALAMAGTNGISNIWSTIAGTYQYVVKAGDLAAGQVVFRLVAAVTSGGYPANKLLVGPISFGAKNLG